MSNDDTSSDSDYNVEAHIRPKRVKKTVDDESADLLGNFDDEKRKEIFEGTYKGESDQNPGDVEETVIDGSNNEARGNTLEQPQKKFAKIEDDETEDEVTEYQYSDTDNVGATQEINTNLTKKLLANLLRGASKVNRHVLYVTNHKFETTRQDLEAYFGRAGEVKSVRIPKRRRGGFAFVEMADFDGLLNVISYLQMNIN